MLAGTVELAGRGRTCVQKRRLSSGTLVRYYYQKQRERERERELKLKLRLKLKFKFKFKFKFKQQQQQQFFGSSKIGIFWGGLGYPN